MREEQRKNNNTLQVFWVALGSLSVFAFGIASAAILSRYFNKRDYGTYRQILYIYNTLLVIFSAGLPRIYEYFLPRYPLEEGKDIVWKVTKLLLGLGLIFSIALYVLSDLFAEVLKNPELAVGLKYFAPIPFLLFPTLGMEGIFATYKSNNFLAKYNIITRLIMLVCILLPVILVKNSYIYAIYGWLAASILSLPLALYFKEIPFKNVISKKALINYKQIFTYSIPLVIASLAGIAIKAADQFYISRYFGTEVFAEYANGFTDLPFVSMISGATATVVMPMFSKIIYEKNGMSRLVTTWNSAITKSAIIIYPMVVFFMAYASETMVLLYSPKYSASGTYFAINLVLQLFNIIIFGPLFFATGKTKLYANVHIVLAILVWTLDYLLVLLFKDPVVIAISTTSLNVIKIIYFVFIASKILEIRFLNLFPVKKISLYLFHATLCIGVTKTLLYLFFNFNSVLLGLAISAVLYFLLLVITSPLIKVNYISIVRPILGKYPIKNDQ